MTEKMQRHTKQTSQAKSKADKVNNDYRMDEAYSNLKPDLEADSEDEADEINSDYKPNIEAHPEDITDEVNSDHKQE